jgi:hypothetical protein
MRYLWEMTMSDRIMVLQDILARCKIWAAIFGILWELLWRFSIFPEINYDTLQLRIFISTAFRSCVDKFIYKPLGPSLCLRTVTKKFNQRL